MTVVGRVSEQAALRAALTAVATDGSSRIAVVEGEPGIGKTTLLDALTTVDVPRRVILAGRAAEFERTLPYALFQDALEPHLRSLDAPSLQRLGDGLDAAAAALPELGKDVTVDAERYQVHRAMRTLLERIAAGRTVALVLDDMHWADPASTELVAALLRRPPDAAVLLVLAHRTGQLPAGLGHELVVADRDSRLTNLRLGPLSTAEAAELLHTTPPDDLLAEAGGNPFYLLQLARAVSPRPDVGVERGAGAALAEVVPSAVAASLAAELGALSTLTQAVAQAAAVAGEPFDTVLVAEIAGVDEADVFGAVDELMSVDLVRGAGAAFRFRHPLVRRGVYGSIVGGWRVAAHRRADGALAARGAGPMTRAHHVAHASAPGDLAAADLLIAAAEEARGRAPELSLTWRRAGIGRLPEVGAGSERRGEQVLLLAKALTHAGRLEESLSVYEDALAAGGGPGVVAACARVELLLGRADAAQARLDAVVGGHHDARARVLLEAQHSAVLRARTQTAAMGKAAERAVAAARETADTALLVHATAQLAVAQAVVNDRDSARTTLTAFETAVRALDTRDVADAADDLSNASWASWYVGAYAAAVTLGDRGVAAAAADGRVDVSFDLLCTRVLALLSLGRVTAAAHAADAALENAQLLGSRGSQAGAHVMLCLARLAVGDIAGSLSAGETALGLADAAGTPTHVAVAAWTLGDALQESGQPQQASELVLSRLGGPELPGCLPVLRPAVYALLTTCALATDATDATDWAERAHESAAALGGAATAQARRAAAEILVAKGADLEGAAALLTAAIDDCERADAGYERLRLRYVLGAARAGAGDTAAAGAVWSDLVADAQAAGAGLIAAQTIRGLRAAGHHVSAPGRRQKGESLTMREREIAELVAERLSNREIAARLFLSEKTIETHLSRVFVKLGVRRRTEVALALEKRGA